MAAAKEETKTGQKTPTAKRTSKKVSESGKK
jgi:hypothetical protein